MSISYDNIELPVYNPARSRARARGSYNTIDSVFFFTSKTKKVKLFNIYSADRVDSTSDPVTTPNDAASKTNRIILYCSTVRVASGNVVSGSRLFIFVVQRYK